jgi:serine-protein kinase ATM
VKGKDDLRQDAVMQQFFHLMNSLLCADPSTCRRGLRIATYKVAAFSGEAGLLQWVDNTISLQAYLVDAHERYAVPGQPMHAEIGNHVHKEHRKGCDHKKWQNLYKQIEQNFPPIMRRFFVERYHDPALWCDGNPTDHGLC